MLETLGTHLTGNLSITLFFLNTTVFVAGVLQMCGGNKKQFYAYLYPDRWPNGSDITISILLDVLSRSLLRTYLIYSIKLTLFSRSTPEDLDADTLYHYMDNAWGSNKNQYKAITTKI